MNKSNQTSKSLSPNANASNGERLGASEPNLAHPIREIQLPHTLIGSEEGRIIITFSPELNYIKVKLSTDNPKLKITCGGKVKPDCVFEFRFDENEVRQKSFEIRVNAVEKETTEQIVISHSLEKESDCEDGEARWVTLKPVPKLEGHPIIGIVRWFLHFSRKWWYVQYPILAIAAVSLFLYFVPTTKVVTAANSVLIWLHVKSPPPPPPPTCYTGLWPNPFEAAKEGQPSRQIWESPKTWTISDGVLHISGEGIGYLKIPAETQAPCDYSARFQLKIHANQKGAAWVARAQDKQHYYLFELLLPSANSGGSLKGQVYNSGRIEMLTAVNLTSIDYHPLKPGDVITVTIEANENKFKNTVSLTLGDVDPKNPNNENEARDIIVTFVDGRNAYAYGSVGFKGGAQYGDVSIVSLAVTGLSK